MLKVSNSKNGFPNLSVKLKINVNSVTLKIVLAGRNTGHFTTYASVQIDVPQSHAELREN